MNMSIEALFAPDSNGYIAFADIILKSSEWLRYANVYDLTDITILRLPLYPLIIALAKQLSVNYWSSILVLFQCVLLGVSGYFLQNFAKILKISKKNVYLLLISYFTGLSLLYSFYILTDSLWISLSVIVFSNLGIFVLSKSDQKKSLMIMAFSLFFMGFLRENAMFFALLLLPLLIMFLRTNKKNALIAAAVLVLSPFLSQELLKNWNYSRK